MLGQTVRISGTPFTIIGVTPRGFFGEHVGLSPDSWLPLTMWGHVVPGRNLLRSPGTGWLRMIGRVPPGVTVSGAHPKLTETFQHVVTEIFGPSMPDDVRRDTAKAIISVEPAGSGLSSVRTQFARPLQLLMAAVVVVLLITCANIANLLLARATARRRETDLRLALGMSRARLVQQLLTESLVLAISGRRGRCGRLVAGTGGASSTDHGRRLTAPVGGPDRRATARLRRDDFVRDGDSVWRGASLALSSSKHRDTLVARREAGAGPHRLGSLLVVAQVALSLVLLMGAGLFLRTIANLREVDLGFAPQRLLIVDVNPQAAGYTSDRAVTLSARLLDEITAISGVVSVSVSEHGVLTGTDNGTNLMRPEGFVAGPEGFPQTRWDVVGPRYFSTVGYAGRFRSGLQQPGRCRLAPGDRD